jgi:protein-S-isoprenylcysteine O-methyltransferase Ste14
LSAAERLCNAVVGLNLIVFAAIGMFAVTGVERFTPVRICITLLAVTVGTLIVVRKPLLRQGSVLSLLLTVPSLVGGLAALSLAPPTNAWPVSANVLFVAGTSLAVVSFLYLSRCFAIFPADRGTVERGPYRLVRHPAYLGEFLMMVACSLAAPAVATAWLPVVVLPCIVVRILAEEKLLAASDKYRAYAGRVIWRLLPGLW